MFYLKDTLQFICLHNLDSQRMKSQSQDLIHLLPRSQGWSLRGEEFGGEQEARDEDKEGGVVLVPDGHWNQHLKQGGMVLRTQTLH